METTKKESGGDCAEASDYSLEEFYRQNGVDFGAGDLFCVGRSSQVARVREFIRLLVGFHDESSFSPFARIVVVIPPGDAAAMRSFETGVNKWVMNSDFLPAETKKSGDWVRVVQPRDLSSKSVISLLGDLPAKIAVIVCDAARYRLETLRLTDDRFDLPEDIWAPHLHALCVDLIEYMRSANSYVAVDAGEFKPRRASNLELLLSIDGLGVVSGEREGDVETLIADHLPKWSSYLDQGCLGPLVQDIEALPVSAEEKAFLRIQMFNRAGHHGATLDEIKRFPPNSSVAPLVLCKLARIAADAGASYLAAQFLRAAVEKLDSIEGLALAVDVASALSEYDLEGQFAARLEQLLPGHPALLGVKLRSLEDEEDYQGQAKLWGDLGNGQRRDLALSLDELLPKEGIADYAAIREALMKRLNNARQIDMALISHARRRQLLMHALDITTIGRIDRPEAAQVVLSIVEDLTLVRDERGRLLVTGDQLKAAIENVVNYLASNALDTRARIRLSQVLSLEVTGTMGIALIASIALDALRRPLHLTKSDLLTEVSIDALSENRVLVERAWQWMGSQSPIVLGQAVLPEELLTIPADNLAPAILKMMHFLVGKFHDEADVKVMSLWLTLGVLINPHTTTKDHDLPMVRLAANAFATAGRVQTARDLAEQGLQLASNTSKRQRTGWFTVADVYQRLGNRLESLIAFACAVSGDTAIDGDEAWDEANGLVRLLRDIGLFDTARQVHAKAWEILNELGLAEANAHRHRFMSLSIDVGEARHEKKAFQSQLPELLDRATVCAEEELERSYNVDPPAILLAQLILWAHLAGVSVPEPSLSAFAKLLENASGPVVRMAGGLSSLRPDAQSVLDIHQLVEDARYANDVAYDGRIAALVSERLLATQNARSDAVVSSFAIEVMTDRAVPAPGWDITSEPLPTIADVKGPAETAKRISKRGISVLMIGSDSEERVSRVIWNQGVGSVISESEHVFSLPDFRNWTERYPYEYGIDEQTPNLFYVSTEALCLSDLPAGPIVVAADAELQQLPCNIIRVGDEFLGQTHPTAAVPSLSWLEVARTNPAQTNGRKVAWISQEEALGQTFVAIASRLADTLEKYDIELDNGASIPSNLAGSEFVVITAHGGLGVDQKYFQRVSDEGSLIATGGHLAAQLRNVGVVVLFVCSGGRTDKAPDAVTTIGLAKELLNQGCTAVLASPWPLDSRVTYHWLPAFLDAWMNGSMLIEANFEANRAVAKGLGSEPAKCLAMTLYGDPLRLYRTTFAEDENQ